MSIDLDTIDLGGCVNCEGSGVFKTGRGDEAVTCSACAGTGAAFNEIIDIKLTSSEWRSVVVGLVYGNANITPFLKAAHAAGVPIPDEVKKKLMPAQRREHKSGRKK